MQDRFKFRAWIKRKGCNYFFKFDQDTFIPLDKFIKDPKCIIEQCTGLKDKNGKLIYEGDIVRYHVLKKVSFPIEKEALVFKTKKVTFKKGYFSPVFNLDLNDVEIIGNVHENPEMLG